MTATLNRRTLLLGLAASALVRPARADAPPGSARVLIELVVFRQNGTLPRAAPLAPLPVVSSIPGRVEPLSADSWQLGAATDALARRGGFKLLVHTAWAAIVPPNGRTTARLADVLDTDSPVTGAIAVQRSQYLFLGVDVDFTSDGQTFGIREKRRVKFGERHYFDHPAFGLIALVRPSKDGAVPEGTEAAR